MLKFVRFFVLFLFFESHIQAQVSCIIAHISTFRNTEGYARITLFNQSEGFPSEHIYGLKSKSVKLDTTSITVEFDSLAYGNYALSVLHDENGNSLMDTNLLGIPKEGYGTSNNINPALRAPNFDEALFNLNKTRQEIKIEIFYR